MFTNLVKLQTKWFTRFFMIFFLFASDVILFLIYKFALNFLQDKHLILVHYMHWNSRHDEWVASNSPRLRPVRSSSRLDSNGTSPTKTHVVSTDTTQLAKDFKTGDKV